MSRMSEKKGEYLKEVEEITLPIIVDGITSSEIFSSMGLEGDPTWDETLPNLLQGFFSSS